MELSEPAQGSEVVLAGYRVERLLRRRSAEDAVYEAVDVLRGTPAELRVVAGRGDEGRRGFQSQAAILRTLRHPSLPEVYRFGEIDQVLYLATARLDGVQLSEAARGGTVPPLQATRLLGGVAEALDLGHSKGLVHGAVRLESVVILEKQVEHPYLVDFVLGGGGNDGSLATSSEGDVRGLAFALFQCLTGESPRRGPDGPPRLSDRRDDLPADLDELLWIAMSSPTPGMSAGDLVSEANRALVAPGPARARPAAVPVPAEHETEVPATAVAVEAAASASAAPSAPAKEATPADPEPREPQKQRRPHRGDARPDAPSPVRPRRRIPLLVALAIVLAAGTAGYLLGRPQEVRDDPTRTGADVRITLPDGWRATAHVPAVRGLAPQDAAGARTPDGRAALVAGRLPGRAGSVYPAAVAGRVDASPPVPDAVQLNRYEALRFNGLDTGDGPATMFVAPTSAGTLTAVCLPPAPRTACEGAVASIELSGAGASSLAAGQRFARLLDETLRQLDRRTSALSARLRRAATSPAQAGIARDLAAAHESARRAVSRADASPASASTQGAVVSALAGHERAYSRLGRAAASRDPRAFAAIRQSLRRGEARLRRILQGS